MDELLRDAGQLRLYLLEHNAATVGLSERLGNLELPKSGRFRRRRPGLGYALPSRQRRTPNAN
jgi:hypothetical protein